MSNWNADNYLDRDQSLNNFRAQQFHLNELHTDTFLNITGSYSSTENNVSGYNNTVANNLPSTVSGETSTPQVSNFIDISHSKLTATAAEFKPRSQTVTPSANNVSNGTIKRPQPNIQNKKGITNKFPQGHTKSYKKQYLKYTELSGSDKTGIAEVRESNKVQFSKSRDQKNTIAIDQINKQAVEENKEVKENGKNHFRSRFGDQYSKSNANLDFKKRWNKNAHYRYNRKYDSHENRNLIHKENWRQPSSSTSEMNKQNKIRKPEQQLDFKTGAASQRERLQQMLEHLQLECMVCCDKLRHTDLVWSCKQCYNILHLSCVKQWAHTSKMETGWRCPACQNNYSDVPKDYYCYCDKVINPKYDPGNLAHSCGEICGRKGKTCDHTCVLLCHPGPCPDCTVPISKACGCGATKAAVICSTDVPVTCQNICNKLLNCGIHTCSSTCHPGECRKCESFVRQECYCGKLGRKISCTLEIQGVEFFECDDICGKLLDCGNHKCQLVCHSGLCPPCPRSINVVTTCPCGQTKLTAERTSCFDPIPCCEKICNKTFTCGQPNDPHCCQSNCHNGVCPPCPLTTVVKCRCGYMDREIVCRKVTTKADDARCEKKCTKMRHCCKHKCNQFCCVEVDHICPLPCNRSLSCGLHRCEEGCHRGRCAPCWRSSFQELYCECGASVIYPPVPCGTRPPICNKPCPRIRSCGHDAFHNCHVGSCPPCTVLCKRWCHGKHEQRTTILCHQDDFSCGLPCGKSMPCGQHKCIQICHTEDCPTPCTQPCPKIRQNCEHPCNQPCHEGECPDVPCKKIVRVTCQCGLRSSTRVCMDLTGEYQSITMKQLASKIADIQKGQAVDITDIVSNQKKCGALKTLECIEECRVAERNRRLAIGLQIRNPDLSAKLTPKYSDFMRNWAKKDARFCQHVHDKLTELVQKAKQSKQKSRSHSFETMNRDKRLFVHEYCQMFGCDSEAYDAEPNRNVVATAYRDNSWLPSIGLLELIQRENGQRKVPGPVLENKNNPFAKRELVPLKPSSKSNHPSTPPGEYVDYFDDPPL